MPTLPNFTAFSGELEMRLSANLGFLWPELPLCDRFAAAARAGFRAVELHWPYDERASTVRRAAEDAGVLILALNSPRGNVAGGEFGMACLPGREREFRDGVAMAFDYARMIGAGAVHVMAGIPGDAVEWRDCLIENLRHAADAAGPLTVLIEALNTSDNPGYAYATMAQADAIRRAVDRPNLRLMLDAYHEATGGHDPVAAWGRYRSVVGHVQIAGIPGRAEPDPAAPPLAGLVAALMRDGYEGWIGCEYRPAAGTDAGLGWRDRIPA